jgi:sak2
LCIGDRVYVKATATLTDHTEGATISTHAFAREAETKKGMDESQITGTASSYARKYALNGLFAIDDTKDADTDEYQGREAPRQTAKQEPKLTAKPFKCSVCGNDVVPISFDGKNYSARAIAEQTTKKKGQCMCWDCYMKAVQS